MDAFFMFFVGLVIVVCVVMFLGMIHLILLLALEDTYEDFIEKVRASMVRRRMFREMHYDSTFSYVVKKNGMCGLPFFWCKEKSFKDEESARNYIAEKKRNYEKRYGKKVIKSTRIK